MGKKITTEEFIEMAKEVHQNEYDYSLVEYKGMEVPVTIICPKHGEFQQTPHTHIHGKGGCPKCKHRSYKLTTEEWIEKATKAHNGKYDYSKVLYKDSKTKVCIICPEHGEFWQLPNNHLKTYGCPKCGKLRITSNTNEFIQKATLVHGNKYNYSKVIYRTNQNKVTITCPIHGDFEQSPNSHLSGSGCPKCNCSKGEARISNFLDKNKILYFKQFEIAIDQDINPSGKAFIDFYVPEYNLFIEFNGIQHYKEVEYFNLNRSFEVQKLRDKYVKQYCLDNQINLLEIPYNEEVDSYLNKILEYENKEGN